MQYDEPSSASDVKDAIEANEGLTEETRNLIEERLGITEGGDTPVNVGTFDGETLTSPGGATPDLIIFTPPPPSDPSGVVTANITSGPAQQVPVWIMQTDYNLDITFNTVERIIASGNGNDKITVNGDKNTTLDGGHGNDTLVTSGGNDSVTGGVGNDSISTGAGNDTIVSGVGHDTVDGGTGLDIVRMSTDGTLADYSYVVQDGKLVVVANDESASLVAQNVEIVSFGEYENIIISNNQDTATALRLYEGVLGRSADLTGAQAWLNGMNDTLTVQQAVQGFLTSAEYLAKGINTTEDFVDLLYQQALYREADAAGRAAWLDGLQNGLSYVDVVIGIVGSEEANGITQTSFLITGQV